MQAIKPASPLGATRQRKISALLGPSLLRVRCLVVLDTVDTQQKHHCGYSAEAFKARAQEATAGHQGDCLQEAHCEAHPVGRTWGAVELDRIHVVVTTWPP